jgi:hypothetical protein
VRDLAHTSAQHRTGGPRCTRSRRRTPREVSPLLGQLGAAVVPASTAAPCPGYSCGNNHTPAAHMRVCVGTGLQVWWSVPGHLHGHIGGSHDGAAVLIRLHVAVVRNGVRHVLPRGHFGSTCLLGRPIVARRTHTVTRSHSVTPSADSIIDAHQGCTRHSAAAAHLRQCEPVPVGRLLPIHACIPWVILSPLAPIPQAGAPRA